MSVFDAAAVTERALDAEAAAAKATFVLCLGFPKCGTTALFEALEKLPNMTALRHPATGTHEIADRLFDADLDPARSYAAKTPTWILDEAKMRRLAARLAAWRVVPVVCVRDPAAQLASYRAHRARVEGETHASMRAFCAARDVAAPGLPYAACATYAPHLRAALRVFGAAAVRALHSDALRDDAGRVGAFLALEGLRLPPRAPSPPVPSDAFSPDERAHWRRAWAATLSLLRDAGVAVLEPEGGVLCDAAEPPTALLPGLCSE